MWYMRTALATSFRPLSTRSISITKVWIWSRLIGVVNERCSSVMISFLISSALFSFMFTSATSTGMSSVSVPRLFMRRNAALAPATSRSEWAAMSSKNSLRWGMRLLNMKTPCQTIFTTMSCSVLAACAMRSAALVRWR